MAALQRLLSGAPSLASGLLGLLLALAPSGCVERRLTIETVPEQAEVFVDGVRIGPSPVTVPFTFYGTREIVVRKPGFETQRHMEVLTPPYFQEFPYDLYYEVMTRDLYVDHWPFRYVLQTVPEEDLTRETVDQKVLEAKELRNR